MPRNYLIENVELNWARLANPVSPFGTPQWELQIATTDPVLAGQMGENNLNVKEKDGKYTVSLKRKAVKADGTEMVPVRLVDAQKNPIENRGSIGNGSKGNVIVWQAEYEAMGKSGVSNSLTAVQVTELVEYAPTGGVDFSVVGDSPAGNEGSLF